MPSSHSQDQQAVVLVDHPRPEVAVLTLNRPEVRNAADIRTWPALVAALEEVLAADTVRAVILTGAGKVFCAGGDLRDPGPSGAGVLGQSQRLATAQRAIEALRDARIPVIAAVEGAAIGIGWALASACDLVIAAAGTRFAAPFLSRGLVPDGGLWWRLARSLGPQAAGAVLYGGRQLTAADLQRCGLVSEVVEDGRALPEAHTAADRIARCPDGAVELTKRMIRQAEALGFSDALHLELTSAALNLTTGAPEEGRRAFLERREPWFGPPRGADPVGEGTPGV